MKKKIVLVVLLIAIFFLIRFVLPYKNLFIKENSLKDLGVSEVTGDNYVFYYPENWLLENSEATSLVYRSIDGTEGKKGESITFGIFKSSLRPADDKYCYKLAENYDFGKEMNELDEYINKGDQMSEYEPKTFLKDKKGVAVFDPNSEYQGCRITNYYAGINNNVGETTEIKIIWYKDFRDDKVYVSEASYFDNTESSIVNRIINSVNSFYIF